MDKKYKKVSAFVGNSLKVVFLSVALSAPLMGAGGQSEKFDGIVPSGLSKHSCVQICSCGTTLGEALLQMPPGIEPGLVSEQRVFGRPPNRNSSRAATRRLVSIGPVGEEKSSARIDSASSGSPLLPKSELQRQMAELTKQLEDKLELERLEAVKLKLELAELRKEKLRDEIALVRRDDVKEMPFASPSDEKRLPKSEVISPDSVLFSPGSLSGKREILLPPITGNPFGEFDPETGLRKVAVFGMPGSLPFSLGEEFLYAEAINSVQLIYNKLEFTARRERHLEKAKEALNALDELSSKLNDYRLFYEQFRGRCKEGFYNPSIKKTFRNTLASLGDLRDAVMRENGDDPLADGIYRLYEEYAAGMTGPLLFALPTELIKICERLTGVPF